MKSHIKGGASKQSWVVVHALVIIALICWISALFFAIFNAARDPASWASFVANMVGFIDMICLIWLWGWMLTDYFRRTSGRRSVAWGWFLVLGNFIAAIMYFFFVWRPHRANT